MVPVIVEQKRSAKSVLINVDNASKDSISIGPR